MSLADELLADFESEGLDDGVENTASTDDGSTTAATATAADGALSTGRDASSGLSTLAPSSSAGGVESLIKPTSLRAVARLFFSTDFHELIARVRSRLHPDPQSEQSDAAGASSQQLLSSGGPIEENPEYQLVVQANAVTVDLDTEITSIHKLVRDLYAKRFPELESLVINPVEYLRTVRLLGNETDKAKQVNLSAFLPAATSMVVIMGAATASAHGQTLSQDTLARILEACDAALELDSAKRDIIYFVESRMTLIAPNLSVLLGPSVAAKLLALTGGLTGLWKSPSCNIQIMGQGKHSIATGLSSAPTAPHAGIIYQSEVVQKTLPEFRKNAMRMLSAKVSLAARLDAFGAKDGSMGRQYLEEIEAKIDKREEPPPVRMVKPLPVPITSSTTRRAGKRVRKAKERLAPTELRKQANRLAFGTAPEELNQMDLGYDLGIAGKTSGKVRAAVVDKKSRVTLSKKLQKTLQKEKLLGGTVTTLPSGAGASTTAASSSNAAARNAAGTATVAFTTVQGLEIINPNAAEKRSHDSTSGYFSTVASFSKARKGGDTSSAMQF